MSEITETTTVQNGQAAVKTVAVSGLLSPKASATDVITVVKTSDGDQAAVKVVNLGGEGGGGSGGDYLPLGGGELTGLLKLYIKSDDDSSLMPVTILQLTMESKDGNYKQTRNIKMSPFSGGISFDGATLNGIGGLAPASEGDNIGNDLASGRWNCAYVKQLNNGADIAIPTTSGTMALKEDIDTAVGNISTALTAILGE